MVRTRIAPSPTGYPHIGTIDQALFDYAFAKRHGGQFIIRIEDTDRERFVADAEGKIFKALDWFDLSEDESPRKNGPHAPYRQSERLDIYKKYVEELIEKGHAYYCFCTKERLDKVRAQMQAEKRMPMYDKHCRDLPQYKIDDRLKTTEKYVVRMKVPENKTLTVRDEIRGDISFESNGIDDQVIMKSDGYPTYHLAVVVDDHEMKITHIVRGEEWISSTPKHYLLYDFFGWEKPLFFHTPLLRNPDKSKLSKRHGHTNVVWYQEQGFLPEAILNFLALLGWSHPEGKDIFDLDEFIQLFDLKDLKPVGPIFDLVKLEWMNGQYIMKLEDTELGNKIFEFYNKEYDRELIGKTVPLVKERMRKLSDYLPLCQFLFHRPEEYELDLDSKKDLLGKIAEKLELVGDWTAEKIGESMVATAKETGTKNSEFFMILRVAISGKKISPPLNESMVILGKKESISRIHSSSK